ncbi:MAG TPA: hypothetical protein VMU71_04930, partial [Terracidiphilus sp.]|nr:hypothetical protein [Terracidiphilus sp.]
MVVMATMLGPGKGRRHRYGEQHGSEEELLHAKNVAPGLRNRRGNPQAGFEELHQERKQGASSQFIGRSWQLQGGTIAKFRAALGSGVRLLWRKTHPRLAIPGTICSVLRGVAGLFLCASSTPG